MARDRRSDPHSSPMTPNGHIKKCYPDGLRNALTSGGGNVSSFQRDAYHQEKQGYTPFRMGFTKWIRIVVSCDASLLA